MTEVVKFVEEEKYCLITLDDGKANALSFDLLYQLRAALDQAEAAGKPVIITGRPGKFSAGFDLNVMGQGGDEMMKLVSGGSELARRLLQFPTPVVLAVTGHALAMGGILRLLKAVVEGLSLPLDAFLHLDGDSLGLALALGNLLGRPVRRWEERAGSREMLVTPDLAFLERKSSR